MKMKMKTKKIRTEQNRDPVYPVHLFSMNILMSYVHMTLIMIYFMYSVIQLYSSRLLIWCFYLFFFFHFCQYEEQKSVFTKKVATLQLNVDCSVAKYSKWVCGCRISWIDRNSRERMRWVAIGNVSSAHRKMLLLCDLIRVENNI